MKTILRNKPQLQTFLVWMKYLFFSGVPPTKVIKPYVFVSPLVFEREALKQAVAHFELKKQGVITI